MMNDTPHEGPATIAVEKQTSKIPSIIYLLGGVGALMGAMALMHRHQRTALMISQWAAPILIMGLYNKLVKTEGHD